MINAIEPAVGGAFLGLSVGMMLLYQGNFVQPGVVIGRALLKPYEDETTWRTIFSLGIFFCGYFLPRLGPSFKDVFEYERVYADVPIGYLCTGAALVGYGSQLGRGCVSSHAIAGLASQSFRSVVWLVVAFASAAGTVRFSEFSQLIASRNVVENSGSIGDIGLPVLDWWMALVFLVTLLAIDLVAIHTMNKFAAEHMLSLTTGLMYGMAMGMAGVHRPSRVLAGMIIGNAWDPTIFIAAAAGLVVAYLTFCIALRQETPLMQFLLFKLPKNENVSFGTIIGAAIFGVGWGMTGQTPSTIALSVIHSNPKALLMVVSGIAGMALKNGLVGILDKEPEKED